jgi:hypothetical protein
MIERSILPLEYPESPSFTSNKNINPVEWLASKHFGSLLGSLAYRHLARGPLAVADRLLHMHK